MKYVGMAKETKLP